MQEMHCLPELQLINDSFGLRMDNISFKRTFRIGSWLNCNSERGN